MDVKILQDLLYVVIIAVVPTVSKFVIDYLQSLKEKEEVNSTSTYYTETESKAISLIQNVVDTISQTYVDALKNKGTFKVKEQKEAFNKALTTTKELMSDDMLDFIKTAYSDVDAWITVQIESYIKSKKVNEQQTNEVAKAIPVIDVSTIQETASETTEETK